jgi:hypothetical protein
MIDHLVVSSLCSASSSTLVSRRKHFLKAGVCMHILWTQSEAEIPSCERAGMANSDRCIREPAVRENACLQRIQPVSIQCIQARSRPVRHLTAQVSAIRCSLLTCAEPAHALWSIPQFCIRCLRD